MAFFLLYTLPFLWLPLSAVYILTITFLRKLSVSVCACVCVSLLFFPSLPLLIAIRVSEAA